MKGSEQCSHPCDRKWMLVLVGDAEDVRKCLIVSILGVLLKFEQVKKNTLYVCFLTHQDVARPNVDSIHIVYQRLLHLCFNFCFFFVFKPIFTEHP